MWTTARKYGLFVMVCAKMLGMITERECINTLALYTCFWALSKQPMCKDVNYQPTLCVRVVSHQLIDEYDESKSINSCSNYPSFYR